MRITERTEFQFSELSDEAQEKAYTKWLEHFEYFWNEENSESIQNFIEAFDIPCKDWGYGDYYSHGGLYAIFDWDSLKEYEYDDNYGKDVWWNWSELSGVRAAKYLLNHYVYHIYESKKIWKNGKYRKSKIDLELKCPTGYCLDYTMRQVVADYINKPDSRTIADVLEDAVYAGLKNAEDDLEYQMSFEAFKESCEANDYWFDEDGRII